METKILIKALKKKEHSMPIAFLLVLFIFGAFYFISTNINHAKSIEDAKKAVCILEHGQWECINGKIVIPFYNSGEKDITLVSISIPVRNGTNNYVANEPLKARKSGALTTENCAEARMEMALLQWCCSNECFESDMKNPNENIHIKIGSEE